MTVTFSLLPPSPSWVSITNSGLLSFGNVPDAGYAGTIRVQAVDGVRSAVKDITVNIQPKYQVLLDYVETSEYVLSPGIGGLSYESFNIQSALSYDLDPGIGGVFYESFNILSPVVIPMDIVFDLPTAFVLGSSGGY